MHILTPLEAEAQRLGFPATLFGHTPQDAAYWYEPGLPWVPAPDSVAYQFTADRRGWPIIWHLLTLTDQRMAPRFPQGCVVNIVPVFLRGDLEVGKVCAHRTGEGATERWAFGRLAGVQAHHLDIMRDNNAGPDTWLLRTDVASVAETWDVYEVTHYASYPAL